MKMEALSVRDILSTQDIVIPEIQREYVWGNNKQLLEILSYFFGDFIPYSV